MKQTPKKVSKSTLRTVLNTKYTISESKLGTPKSIFHTSHCTNFNTIT